MNYSLIPISYLYIKFVLLCPFSPPTLAFLFFSYIAEGRKQGNLFHLFTCLFKYLSSYNVKVPLNLEAKKFTKKQKICITQPKTYRSQAVHTCHHQIQCGHMNLPVTMPKLTSGSFKLQRNSPHVTRNASEGSSWRRNGFNGQRKENILSSFLFTGFFFFFHLTHPMHV